MAKDFRATQIETTKIILSGGIGGSTLGGIVYSGSVATDREGGIPSTMLDNVGSDVELFISGTIDGRGNGGIVLVGGDLVVSGGMVTQASVYRNTNTKSANFNVIPSDHFLFVDSSSGHVTASLQAASQAGPGRELIFKDIAGFADVNNVVLRPSVGDNIEGVNNDLTIKVSSGSIMLTCDGVSNYYVVGERS